MGEASAALEDLRPVTFRYTEEAAGEGSRPVEFGLIAEEVVEVYPDLVVYDEEGEPYSVRYHVLAPMLVNELQKQQRRIQVQGWLLGVMLLAICMWLVPRAPPIFRKQRVSEVSKITS